MEAKKKEFSRATETANSTLLAGQRPKPAVDEISKYVSARYISAGEAFWRIYGFDLHRNAPNVVKLMCHLDGEQSIMFEDEPTAEGLRLPPKTMLTAYFALNEEDEDARTICYNEIPKYYTWDKSKKKWKVRQRGHRNEQGQVETDTIGRIPIVTYSNKQSELYYLRILLYKVPGATSFEDLRQGLETNQAACLSLGLIEDDGEVDKAMDEIVHHCFGRQLVHAWCNLLLLCLPPSPAEFYERWRDDLARALMRRSEGREPSDFHRNRALLMIRKRLAQEDLQMSKFGLPEPDDDMPEPEVLHYYVREEMHGYDRPALADRVMWEYPSLNEGQRSAFDTVLASVRAGEGRAFCLDASGGCGKTHTTNLILAAARSEGLVAVATAISCIASNLLDGGHTLHSRLGVPIRIKENSTCQMTKRDWRGKLFQACHLLVIDEVTMGHRMVYEAVDRSLRFVRGQEDRLFGGLTVLFAGDWKQILPVVLRGTRAQIVDATLKRSYIWQSVEVLTLTENMRVTTSDTGEAGFAALLEDVGNGALPVHEDLGEFRVRIPQELLLPSEQDLIQHVYGEMSERYLDPEWLCSRAIITTTNASVELLNRALMQVFPSDEMAVYRSMDVVRENELEYPLEFINDLNPSGFPPHVLVLRRHAPIMLLRNLDPTEGHVNGQLYTVRQLLKYNIEAEVATGEHKGKRLMVPRIPFNTDEHYPFSFTRRQHPVKPAFARTANKAQGQTLSCVGIHLPGPYFVHGQMYVAMSRVGAADGLRIFADNSAEPGKSGHYTDNVVYPEIL